jgi:WS/DGAT/MGAT family acyltransferase
LEIVVSGAVKFVTSPLKLRKMVPATASTVIDTIRRAVAGQTMAAPFTAPKTAFNANVTGHRNIAFAHLDLDDVKTVKNHFGVKVNDVVMALVAGALRRFLLDRDELPDSTLIAMVPVSVHDKSDRPGRNQVSGMFTKLETGIEDPAERLKAIADANSVAKQHSSAIGATLLQDWTQFAAPAVFATAMRVLARSNLGAIPVHNVIVSNVPGPQIPLYFLGAKVKAMYPLGPIMHGCGLNVTVMSLSGGLDVGLISCTELLPDLWGMADHFTDALDELLATTR